MPHYADADATPIRAPPHYAAYAEPRRRRYELASAAYGYSAAFAAISLDALPLPLRQQIAIFRQRISLAAAFAAARLRQKRRFRLSPAAAIFFFRCHYVILPLRPPLMPMSHFAMRRRCQMIPPPPPKIRRLMAASAGRQPLPP